MPLPRKRSLMFLLRRLSADATRASLIWLRTAHSRQASLTAGLRWREYGAILHDERIDIDLPLLHLTDLAKIAPSS